jgi:hypothetical protein
VNWTSASEFFAMGGYATIAAALHHRRARRALAANGDRR